MKKDSVSFGTTEIAKLTAAENGMLKKILPDVEELAVEAGELLLKYSKKLSKLKVHHKPSEGLASEADIASEKLIKRELGKKFPGFFFLGEEEAFALAGADKQQLYQLCSQQDWSWVVDPLDGTNNFLNGLDYYAVCIGLLCQGRPVLGVVYRPSTRELYSARLGGGAYFQRGDDRRTKMAGPLVNRKLSQALMATGFSTEKGENFDWEFSAFKKIMSHTRGVRRFGSAALDLCWVAQGKIEGFWESALAPWDMAAAGIICEETGVVLTDFKGRAFHPFVSNILAASPKIHAEVLVLISKI